MEFNGLVCCKSKGQIILIKYGKNGCQNCSTFGDSSERKTFNGQIVWSIDLKHTVTVIGTERTWQLVGVMLQQTICACDCIVLLYT